MDPLDVKGRPRDPRSAEAEADKGGVTPRQVEQALLGLGHRLAGAGYGVLIWDRPGSAVEPEPDRDG